MKKITVSLIGFLMTVNAQAGSGFLRSKAHMEAIFASDEVRERSLDYNVVQVKAIGSVLGTHIIYVLHLTREDLEYQPFCLGVTLESQSELKVTKVESWPQGMMFCN